MTDASAPGKRSRRKGKEELIAIGIDLGDPGAIAVVGEKGDGGFYLFQYERISGKKESELGDRVDQALWEFEPILIATERPFRGGRFARVGMAQREKEGVVKRVCQEHQSDDYKPKFADFPPTSIKKAVTGNGRASKQQVKAMVEKLLDVKGLNEDEADACAIAMTALNRSK